MDSGSEDSLEFQEGDTESDIESDPEDDVNTDMAVKINDIETVQINGDDKVRPLITHRLMVITN